MFSHNSQYVFEEANKAVLRVFHICMIVYNLGLNVSSSQSTRCLHCTPGMHIHYPTLPVGMVCGRVACALVHFAGQSTNHCAVDSSSSPLSHRSHSSASDMTSVCLFFNPTPLLAINFSSASKVDWKSA